METQGLVAVIPWTLIAQLCNLFIQMLLIKKFLLKPIRNVLKKRQEMADSKIREAEQARLEADNIKSEYEQNMANAREKAEEIIAAANRSASDQSDRILKEANQQATAIKAKAGSDIELERKKAVNDLKNEIGGMAVEIAGKVISREVNEADHMKLIDDFISNIGNAS